MIRPKNMEIKCEVEIDPKIARIKAINDWLKQDYLYLMGHYQMCKTLGVPCDYTERSVCEKRYRLEQELRELTNQQPLPDYKKYIDL